MCDGKDPEWKARLKGLKMTKEVPQKRHKTGEILDTLLPGLTPTILEVANKPCQILLSDSKN